MNEVNKLLKGILEEEMSAEMRTWLMELSLLIDEIPSLHQPQITDANNNRLALLDFADHLNTYPGMEDVRFDFMVEDYLKPKQLPQ